MRWTGIAHRAHDPRWSWLPTSGEGARARGGRFNPPGTPALYLASSIEGMLLEVQHGFAHRLDPLTICAYEVDAEDIVDLRTETACNDAQTTLATLACHWALDVAEGRVPPTWTLAQSLIDQGSAGVLVPSFARGARPAMHNLVLWRWGDEPPHKVAVIDPEGRLPRNPASWTL